MAIIHSSYYAMFHAARAVLFEATGNAPKRHDGVIQQFGLLVRDLDDALRVAGKAFTNSLFRSVSVRHSGLRLIWRLKCRTAG
jgi:uncharacterized protein (UPF0332 family)